MLVGEFFGCKIMVIEILCEGMIFLNEEGYDEDYEKVMYRIINFKFIIMG